MKISKWTFDIDNIINNNYYFIHLILFNIKQKKKTKICPRRKLTIIVIYFMELIFYK